MSKQRYRTIDIAKGIGIFLVILGHSLKQTEVDARWIRILNCLIYSFHMPLFFVLSGFVSVRILRMTSYRERWKYIGKRAVRLLVPYFTLSLIYIPVKLRLNAYAVKPFRAQDTLKILIGQSPDVSLWFLYILFIISALCTLFVNEGNYRSILYGSAALCAAAWWVNIPLRTLQYLFFFLAGIWIRLKKEDKEKDGQRYLFTDQTAAAVIAAVVFLILNRLYYRYGVNILRLGTSICGIYLTLYLSEFLERKVSGRRITEYFEKSGMMSMDLYILHEPLMTASKILFWNRLGLSYGLATLLIFLCAYFLPWPISLGVLRKVPVFRLLFLGDDAGLRRKRK